MKIQFDAELKYQEKAIESVVNIFEGQEICQSNFSVAKTSNIVGQKYTYDYNELGIGNRLELLDDEILKNIQNIQLKNGLPQSKKLDSMDFSVEMETGTGKTYVYLRSIFQMHKKYGFTKFIIVVPSVAIKEGTKKTLDITIEHFKSIFNNINYDYFIYNSSNLEQVRDFATSSDIRIMVINIGAFIKSFKNSDKDNKANIIHRANDRLNGQKPIEFIASTNPIVIIDEPQSVDKTDKAKEAIKTLNSLCRLRYSATHIEKFNLMYKLDSIDAYEQKLVKQIEVANVQASESANSAYIELISVKQSPRSAKIKIDINEKGSIKRKQISIKDGSDLYELSKGRDVYKNFTITDIYTEKGNEYIEFGNGESLGINEFIGDMDDDTIKRLQVRKTIEEHLDKELELNSKGIKVLSLFFIDRVANYRKYDEEGNEEKGKYAKWFEEEFIGIAKKRKYSKLFEGKKIEELAVLLHDGYFSQDKKGKLKDSKLTKEGELRVNADDESTFNKIMKNKEKLLSFDEPLRFIFSHSALKEGWDNPNVFQICTLNETNSAIKKRQEIGRGLRICLNQEGERVYGFDVNTLTIMANESYEDFARGLQEEIENEEGIKFGVVEEYFFANIPMLNEHGDNIYFGAENSENIYKYLLEKEYIDEKGKIQDSLRKDIRNDKFEVPNKYKHLSSEITSAIKKIAGNLNIKDANKKELIKLNKEVLLGEDFKELWNKIKYKTTYRVDFNTEDLINSCAKKLNEEGTVGKIKYIYSKATNKITKVGIEIAKNTINIKPEECEIIDYKLPDIITYLQNEINLTRRDIVQILIKSKKLDSFKNNPQKFIDKAIEIIKKTMSLTIVDGIKYEKIGDDFFYAQECFENNELYGYLSSNMYENRENKSIYGHTVCDSDIEMKFAKSFNENKEVKLFTKLPSWFKISTPLGSYNPDWAVLIEKDNEEKLYFVVESKGSDFSGDLRETESAKIKCGQKHFEAISENIQFIQAKNYDSFSDNL